jgi:preprotein translocase subunit YajC
MSLFSLTTIIADEAVQSVGASSYISTLLMIGLAIVFFYFMILRPEQKRRKKTEAQRAAMKKGDRVTAMGIVGTVYKIQDQTVILEMVDGAKIEVLKGAISDIQSNISTGVEKV